MDHVANGPLNALFESKEKQEQKLSLELARFYAAWLVLALEHLHG
jgi:hypothetical protein